LVGEKQLAETNYNVVPFPDKPNEIAKYISRRKTIGCYHCDWAYVAVESRGKVDVAKAKRCSSSPDSPLLFFHLCPNRILAPKTAAKPSIAIPTIGLTLLRRVERGVL
jgi:hypothetical protein